MLIISTVAYALLLVGSFASNAVQASARGELWGDPANRRLFALQVLAISVMIGLSLVIDQLVGASAAGELDGGGPFGGGGGPPPGSGTTGSGDAGSGDAGSGDAGGQPLPSGGGAVG